MKIVFSSKSGIRLLNDRVVLLSMQKGLVLLLSVCISLAGLTGCIGDSDDENQELQAFPEFSATADDGQNYNLNDTNGAFIAVFSAEWCSNPCHSSMHNIWAFQEGLQVYVFSTDATEDPQGITLSDWHDAADGYDDEYDDSGNVEDEGVSLTSYKFMKGSEIANELGIQNPGTIVFVNSAKEITYVHKGILDDQEVISEQWSVAN